MDDMLKLKIDLWKALLLTLLVFLILSASFYAFVQTDNNTNRTVTFSANEVVLFVTAHPDDECMFFGPTILQAAGGNPKNSHLLCLTTGNFYNKGRIRQKELLESCKVLGFPASNIQIKDNSAFLDGNQKWNFNALLPELLEYVRTLRPDYIFTFDDYGVSGHLNHIATSHAIRQLYKELQPNDKIPAIYELESVPLYRKYLSFIDVPISVMSSRFVFISSPSDVFKAQKAMLAHRTQLVWFRWLYILFSRYMLVNTFKEVPP